MKLQGFCGNGGFPNMGRRSMLPSSSMEKAPLPKLRETLRSFSRLYIVRSLLWSNAVSSGKFRMENVLVTRRSHRSDLKNSGRRLEKLSEKRSQRLPSSMRHRMTDRTSSYKRDAKASSQFMKIFSRRFPGVGYSIAIVRQR